MREIKFRAWDSETEEMYYTGESFDIIFYFDSEGIVAERVTEDETEKLEHLEYMAYTGLKDKNGKEIYEGDIVKHATDEGVYKVIFEDGGFYVKNLFEYDFQTINEYPLEVIGNIYENPELLEEESE